MKTGEALMHMVGSILAIFYSTERPEFSRALVDKWWSGRILCTPTELHQRSNPPGRHFPIVLGNPSSLFVLGGQQVQHKRLNSCPCACVCARAPDLFLFHRMRYPVSKISHPMVAQIKTRNASHFPYRSCTAT